METDDMTTWMLAEHEKVHQLSDELEEKVKSPPRGDRAQWIADLRQRFDEYADRMREHFRKEEEGGYLAHVVDLRPTLSEAVEIIRNEHEELITIIESLQTAVRELAPTDNLLFRDCCKRIEHLLLWLHIMMYAFTQDIGAAD